MSSRIQPSHRAAPPTSRQRWESLAFLHWRVGPEALRPHVPPGLKLQTADGSAWVGVTPFVMRRLRPPAMPPVPVWSTFPEINVRTYVTDPHGHEGLWFLSLEATRRVVVAGLRLGIGLPYRHAHITFDDRGDEIAVVWRRDLMEAAGSVRALGRGEPVRPGSLEDFLTGQWNAFGRRAGLLLRTPVTHAPWVLRPAEAQGTWSSLLAAGELGDLGLTDPPDHVMLSPGVAVRVGVPRAV